jgi:competence protein ComEC
MSIARHVSQRSLAILFATVLAFIVVVLDPLRGTSANQVDVWFFDIGQGDAALIQSGSTQIIIDGGPTGTLVEKVGRVMPFWDSTIEYTFVSHPHEDHFIGLLSLGKHYNMEQVFVAPQMYGSQSWQVFIDSHEEKVFSSGAEFQITPEITAQVIWPEDSEVKEYEDPNDGSLVILFTIYGKKVLFTGDAGVDQEAEYIKDLGDIDILKVGHHGSYTSTSRALLETAQPEDAIISCGADNDYGHPHNVTLNRLEEFGITTWRTDLQGDIRARIDESGYEMGTFAL